MHFDYNFYFSLDFYLPLFRIKTVIIKILGHREKKQIISSIQKHFLRINLQAHGIVYVIDGDKNASFDLMRDQLQMMMRHKHVRQKPLLIVVNKQDLSESLDLVDITYYFHIGEMANLLGTPTFIAACGQGNYNDLFVGVEWLSNFIVANWHVLTNRIRFNRSILSPVVKLKRQMTSTPRKVSISL